MVRHLFCVFFPSTDTSCVQLLCSLGNIRLQYNSQRTDMMALITACSRRTVQQTCVDPLSDYSMIGALKRENQSHCAPKETGSGQVMEFTNCRNSRYGYSPRILCPFFRSEKASSETQPIKRYYSISSIKSFTLPRTSTVMDT